MEIISSRFNGEVSRNDFLRQFPPVQVFSYQCSPLSTAQGIEQTFEAARRYQREAPKTCVVVLLDEVHPVLLSLIFSSETMFLNSLL